MLPGVRDEHEGGTVDEDERARVGVHGDAVVLTLPVMPVDGLRRAVGRAVPEPGLSATEQGCCFTNRFPGNTLGKPRQPPSPADARCQRCHTGESMIGPVQLIMIGYDQPELPAPLVTRIQELTADPAVDVIDVLDVYKDRQGYLQHAPVAGITTAHPDGTDGMILALLTKAGAAGTMMQSQWTGPSHLFQGDRLPDPHDTVPTNGSHVLVVLVEHRWAAPLRDTAAEVETHAVANRWIGRDLLKELKLMPQDTR